MQARLVAHGPVARAVAAVMFAIVPDPDFSCLRIATLNYHGRSQKLYPFAVLPGRKRGL
jgi:hypothetical protein